MSLGIAFFLQNILLGVGLAMDAFSVSLANGLHEPNMKKHRMCGMAGIFALFQAAMPMIGWICVHTIVNYFQSFETLIPWIALGLLGFIGGKMLYEGIKDKKGCGEEKPCLGLCGLLVQGIATSIDALSVGFTIAEYDFYEAILAVTLIAAVTFVICLLGLLIGKQVGTKIAGKAGILGGAILILIGLEIFITGVF
ncbi:MAG: manganese efflux pump [Ruminococcaceae bacterium]|nr:manganese efflux pump [Oscillospiraceae bacterium]